MPCLARVILPVGAISRLALLQLTASGAILVFARIHENWADFGQNTPKNS